MNSFLSIQYSFQRYFIHLWKIIRIGGRIHSINLESRQYFVDEVWTRHASIESLLGDAFTYSHACTRVPIGTQYSGTYGNIATRIGESRSRTTCNRMIAVNTCVTCASKLEQTWISLGVEDARSMILVARNCVYKRVCSKNKLPPLFIEIFLGIVEKIFPCNCVRKKLIK